MANGTSQALIAKSLTRTMVAYGLGHEPSGLQTVAAIFYSLSSKSLLLLLLVGLPGSPSLFAQSVPPNVPAERPLTDEAVNRLLDVNRYTATQADAAIAPPDIDRMVFNRLLREIMDDPEQMRRSLNLSKDELPELSLLLSNSLQYTNIDHARAHQQMCISWQTNPRAEDRRDLALAAYDASIAQDKRYLAEVDRRLLLSIEALLSPIAWEGFREYMADRRRRLATVRSLSDHASATAKGLTRIEISSQCGHSSR